MTFDVARARRETPGCSRVAHFNNAGSALPPTCVTDSLRAHLDLEAQIGGYEAEAAAEELIADSYDAIATLIHCDRDEIAMVENATRAWDMAFYAMHFEPGDHILTGKAEYASNVIAFLQIAKRTGARIEVVPDDEHGQIDIGALRSMVDERVKLIALTHVPTNGGLVNPAAEVGQVARASGVPYLLDACQSVGQMPINVEEIGCDFLSATGRKFLRAPRGTGFLYVRRHWIERLEPPFLDLHAAQWVAPNQFTVRADARRFENWEHYVAGRIGLGVAVRYALSWGLSAIRDRILILTEYLRARLSQVPGLTLRDKGVTNSAIITFTIRSEEPSDLAHRLSKAGFNVSVSVASSTLYDMHERGLASIVRVSPHYYNDFTEVDRLVEAISRAS
ncbi:aminotransferase class V-fold PLP-dependent enzyme [Chelatococcus asaccharovorans]|uniref:aminotransferase class V-fold PLP-dependent enzyme n=1 Tax=Chelatococcus asaccharovorans TaxID=28210 RepID=UPI00224C63CC|nr:aminotransferase class V-fold PLP-dependent enzyme [Chelatococcus asaccharovorans]CAH1664686.1 Aminotransferase class V [Chelatococcus asaccharovorans]CAH1682281.1 Aminotransferase class V [Chelatococcus asaccharovorans]